MSEPAKNAPDWDFIKGLYLRGVRRAEICAQGRCSSSALDQRIRRGKWRDLRDRVSVPAATQKISIAERREVVRELMAVETHAQISNLSTIPNPKSADGALVKASALDKLGSVSEKVFGSVDGQKRCKINIGLLQSVRTIEPGTLTPEERQNMTYVDHANGWTKLTLPNGAVQIVDDRERALFPHRCANAPPPDWKESPPTRELPPSTSEPITYYPKYNLHLAHGPEPDAAPVIDVPSTPPEALPEGVRS